MNLPKRNWQNGKKTQNNRICTAISLIQPALRYLYGMNLQQWLSVFIGQVKQTGPLEWVATAASVAEVLLAKANNVLLYPAGIIGTALYIYFMADARLFGEAALSGYYLVMSIYGWYHWVKKKNAPAVPVSCASKKEWAATIGIVLIGWALFYWVLTQAHSSQPLWDGWVSATAWAGMWLLARRKIENWILLNISNIFAIPLLIYKQLPLFACLTLFLFIVAIFGFFEWRKIYRAGRVGLS